MRWPWQKPVERRSGGYTDSLVSAAESAAASKAANASATAAVEAVAGLLSRAFGDAIVEAEPWAAEAITPVWLMQVGRDLIRGGESLSVVNMTGGRVHLVTAGDWDFLNSGGELEDQWQAQVTTYAPSSTRTRMLARDRLVFVRWGSAPGIRYVGRSPAAWASATARLAAAVEGSLADEAGGPVAQIIPIPDLGDDGGDGDSDPLAALRADITGAKGKAILPETTSAGYGAGRSEAPLGDWQPRRLGPDPPAAMADIAAAAFARMVAACGASVSLFTDADGTAQREALRRWHLGTVKPLGRLLAHELTARLDTPVRLRFDAYPTDLAGRAGAFKALVGGGMAVTEAAAVSGLLVDD